MNLEIPELVRPAASRSRGSSCAAAVVGSAMLALAVGGGAGCGPKKDQGHGGAPSAAASSVAPRPSVARVVPRMALPSAPPPAAHQETVAIRFIGSVKPVEAAKGLAVFASFDDCLGPKVANIGQDGVAPDGTFNLEIFAPWGADFSVCVYEEVGPKLPSKRYGKAATVFRPRQPGDMKFRDIVIDVASGTPRVFPGPRPSGGF